MLAAGATLVALVTLQVALPDPFVRLRNYGFDTMQRLAPRPDADDMAPGSGVVVVDIEEASLARFGQWPWSRSRVADLIGTLQEAGAAAIGLDIVFAEPDRTSPSTLAPRWALDHGLKVAAAESGVTRTVHYPTLPDYDRDLAAVIGRGRVVTGYGLLPSANGRAPALANEVAVIGADPAPTFAGFRGAVPNLPALDRAAAGQGSFTISGADSDDIIRRLPLFMTLNHVLVPSLAAEVLRVAAGSDEDTRLREERPFGPGTPVTGYAAEVGGHVVSIGRDGAMWLRYGARRPERTLSAARVLEGDLDALRQRVEHRIVLIGTSAVGLSDLRPTPLSPFEPGVDIQAAAVEQILGDVGLDRPFYAAGAELRVAMVFGLSVALLTVLAGLRAGATVLLGGAAAAVGGVAAAFAWANLLFDASLPILAGTSCYVAATLARHLWSERRANKMRAAFRQYLSPQLVEALARDPDRLRLGGEERDMTFLFTDLEGFTSFTVAVEPALLVSTLNAYLDGVCAIAMDHGGTIDKIVGDAVHVMFNAPLDQPDHAARAVRCGLAIDGFCQAFAADAALGAAAGRAFGTTRIGINTGRAVVGNFGGRRRFDYTAHGDAINTAARLEAANKRLGTRICVAGTTVEAVGLGSQLRFRPIGGLGLKGKTKSVAVFAPSVADGPETAWADRYGDAFARLSRGDEDGPDAIMALLVQYPDDPLLRFHAERIARGLRGTDLPLQAA